MADTRHMLLVEPTTLLRRTVALTARSMGVAQVHEAASYSLAMRLLKGRAFDGAVIAFDQATGTDTLAAIALLDKVRGGDTFSPADIPIAVMIDRVDANLVHTLRERGVMRILLKPFRARNLIDTFSEFAATPPVPPARATGAAQAPQGARPA